jgi:F420-0:gamma-glutamyl ligase
MPGQRLSDSALPKRGKDIDELIAPAYEALKDESVLIEAHRIVSQRNDAYGEPTDTAERVATAFSALTKRVIRSADVALIQILFKIVRSEHGYKRDNNVDLAGYTDIRERCLLKEMEDE